ncbi:MAG: hypothetical protein V4619_09095, partial [Bacteroidota bacterium]
RNGVIMNCLRFYPPPHLIDLYRYLIANNKIEDIRNYNENNLHVQTDIVLQLIKQGADGWEQFVPPEVAAIIKERCLFGYPRLIEKPKEIKGPEEAESTAQIK